MCHVHGFNYHILLYMYMGVVTLPSNLAETTLASNCQEGSSADRPKIYPKYSSIPHLSFDLPTNVSNSSFNDLWSKLLYKNCQVSVDFECVASYPVEWVEHYDQDIEVLTDTNHVIRKTLWTERAIQHEALVQHAGFHYSNYSDPLAELPPSLTKYTAFLGIYYQKTSLCAAANYTCRSVSNQCLQSSVISVVDQQKETIKYYEEPDAGSDYNNYDHQNRTCETIIEVAVNDNGRVGWKCKGSVKYPELTPYIRNCDYASDCNSFFRYQQQQNCVKRLQSLNECTGCMFSNKSSGFLLHPGYIYCEHEPSNTIVTANQYFHSIAQSTDPHEAPELYLNWVEADPQKMLYLEPVPQPVYVGETRTIFCRVSRYYFSYGYRFGFEYSNGTMRYTQSIDGMHDTNQNINRMNVTFNFTDISLKRIFCFAPVWNSTEWVNQSTNFQMIKGAIAPYFVSNAGKIKFSEDEHVVLKLHQTNATLSCKVDGQPTPEIKWIFDNKNVESTEISVEPGRKDLIFKHVDKSLPGKYQCMGTNFLGSATKTFHVTAIDELADIWAAHQHKTQLWEGTIAFSATFLILFVVILGMCWRKVRMQRKQIQSLSEDEIKEFRLGNSDILGNSQYLDTQELLQAIPYNDEYEISSKRLYIDPSEVLGSGNFGQVIKGAIYDGNDKRNCNVVAVKTVKSNYDISYFQTLLTEVKIMAYIGRHTNVVSLVGACTENIRNHQIFIAVEYCAKGSLEKFLKNCRPSFINLVCGDTICITTSFSENRQNHTYENSEQSSDLSTIHLLRWSREIANGMDFLGSKKIVHGDLAARNILLTEEFVAKIGDFGLSRVLMTYSNYVRSTQDDCLLPWKWMALETLEEMKFSVMSDVWSYGGRCPILTLWEIFSLAQHPFPGVTYNTAFVGWLKSGHRLDKPFYANSEIYNLMMECWSSHPSQRPTFSEMKDFFEGLLLQTCDTEYVRTKLYGPTQYMNGPSSCSVQNPGYSFLGKGNMLLGKEDDDTTNESDKSSCHTSLMTTSEDYQGYMKPLMIDHGYAC